MRRQTTSEWPARSFGWSLAPRQGPQDCACQDQADLNEAPEEAAKRELAEEVGLDGTIDIGANHLTVAGPAIFLCYAMSAPGEFRIDHGEISDHTWASPDEFDAVDWLSNTMLSLASASFSQGHLGLIDSTAARGRPYHLFTNAEVTT